MKIIDYAFCSGKNTFELIEDVGAALINGFQPYYSPHLSHSSCVQIMVKYETEKESFDKSMAEEINKLSEDLNEKLFSELLKTSIKENELLRDEIKRLKEIIKIEREFSQQLNQKITDYRIEISSLIQEKFELKESIGFIK